MILQGHWARPLLGVWAAGSLVMGTVAALLVRFVPAASGDIAQGNRAPSMLGALLLVGMLFGVLAVIAWRMTGESWLAVGLRPRLLWVAVVGACGLAGWGYAATVTFAIEMSTQGQLILGYLGGGLPFMLVAAMLARPWQANVAAIAATAGLLAAGYLLVHFRTDGQFDVFRLGLIYLAILLDPGTATTFLSPA